MHGISASITMSSMNLVKNRGHLTEVLISEKLDTAGISNEGAVWPQHNRLSRCPDKVQQGVLRLRLPTTSRIWLFANDVLLSI